MVDARDPIQTLVQGAPVTIGEKLTLRAVAAVLAADGIGAALVLQSNSSMGIVSERDVVRALANDADPDLVWSADVMTADLVTAQSDEPVMTVALRLADEAIRHIVILEEENVVGIVSSRDVFRVLAEDLLESW